MADALTVRDLFSVAGAAYGFLVVFTLFVARMWNGSPAMFAQWIDYKRAKAAEKAADFTRMREEIERVSAAEQRCRTDFDHLHHQFIEREVQHSAEIAALRGEIGELRGLLTGHGQIRQLAAGVVAIERTERKGRDEAAQPDPE